MGEENQGFPIPANRPPFEEGDLGIEVTPLPESDLFMVFTNDDRDRADVYGLCRAETFDRQLRRNIWHTVRRSVGEWVYAFS